VDFENFYEAPSYLWKTKPLTEQEMEAIMVSDAMRVDCAVTDRTEQNNRRPEELPTSRRDLRETRAQRTVRPNFFVGYKRLVRLFAMHHAFP
jgi:hypothetical protein